MPEPHQSEWPEPSAVLVGSPEVIVIIINDKVDITYAISMQYNLLLSLALSLSRIPKAGLLHLLDSLALCR